MKWEYKILEAGGGGLLGGGGRFPTEEQLNALGDEEWELVGTLTSSEMGFGGRGSKTSALVFKRPKERA